MIDDLVEAWSRAAEDLRRETLMTCINRCVDMRAHMCINVCWAWHVQLGSSHSGTVLTKYPTGLSMR